MVPGSSLSSRRRGIVGHQQGNGLVFALLGLLVSALGVAGAIQGTRLQVRREAGLGEASVLENLRNATNGAIFDSLAQIQRGEAITHGGITVQPVDLGGTLVWRPDITQLVAMGYLP